MNVSFFHYEKSEIIHVSEELYRCQGEQHRLERELSSLKFYYSNIPQRAERAKTDIFVQFILILVVTGIVRICIYAISIGSAFTIVTWGIILGFCVIAYVYLIGHQINVYKRLQRSKDPQLCKENTFQREEIDAQKQIKQFEEQIACIKEQIQNLKKRKEELLSEAKQETPEESTVKPTGLTLKPYVTGGMDTAEIYEFYQKQEAFLKKDIADIDAQLKSIDNEIMEIDTNFEDIKRNMIFWGIVIVVFGLMQIITKSVFLAVACFIGGCVYIYYVDRRWKRPILSYLIEHDSHYVTEYTFVTGKRPVKDKRKDLLEKREWCEKQLEENRKMQRE